MLAAIFPLFLIAGIVMLAIGTINVLYILGTAWILYDEDSDTTKLVRKIDKLILLSLAGSFCIFLSFVFYVW